MANKHQTDEQNAQTLLNWLNTRGGIAIWGSENLADPGKTWTTPVKNSDGTPRTEKPHWSAGNIIRVITEPAEVEVVVPKEVGRFHVAVRRGSNGMALKLTDASTRRLRRAVANASQKHNCEAWYAFDYMSQDAVIFVPEKVVSLDQWAKQAETVQSTKS